MQHPNEFLPSRLHKLSMLILEALESVIESRRHADKELQTILRSHDFEFVEREFVVEVLFDMLRNFRLLQAAAQTREYNHDLFSAWLALRNYTTASVKNLQDLKKTYHFPLYQSCYAVFIPRLARCCRRRRARRTSLGT
jgi:hypothetical protein